MNLQQKMFDIFCLINYFINQLSKLLIVYCYLFTLPVQSTQLWDTTVTLISATTDKVELVEVGGQVIMTVILELYYY